jgi:ribonuclease BN (tRNA processing enzyme)
LDGVAEMAEGADVLVHERMHVPAVEKYIKGHSSGASREI